MAHNLFAGCGDYTYIWQADDWPSLRYDLATLTHSLADVSRAQGLLMGRLADVGMALRDQASLLALTEDVVQDQRQKIRRRRSSTSSLCAPPSPAASASTSSVPWPQSTATSKE